VGHIQVISNIPHADVVINQVQRGRVNEEGLLNVRHVRGEVAVVVVKAEGYYPQTQEIELIANQWQQVGVTLKRRQKKCYVGDTFVLETKMERLEKNTEFTNTQKSQLKSLVTEALTQNQLNIVLPSQQSRFKVSATIVMGEDAMTAIKTSFKTVGVTITLKLIDNKTGSILARVNKGYRKAGSNADEILRNILRLNMSQLSASLLAQACEKTAS